MKAIIYQMKVNEGNRSKLFMSYKDNKGKITLKDYDKVAVLDINTQGLDDNDVLEQVYAYGNSHTLGNGKARSISVSDIIKLYDEYYYCDSFGFENITADLKLDNIVEHKEDRLVNPDDETYYDSLYLISVYSGAGSNMVDYKVYANSEQHALEILSAYLEKEAPGYLIDTNSVDEDQINDLIYIDGTAEGASKPYYFSEYTTMKDITNLKLQEDVSDNDEDVTSNIISQLLELGMDEDQAKITADGLLKIFERATNKTNESVTDVQDKLTVKDMGILFNHMKELGWNGDIKTADEYFDKAVEKYHSELLREDVDMDEITPEDSTEADNYESEQNLDDEETSNESKAIVDYIQDRIGQEISIGEFNVIMQSIFGKFNELFLSASTVYDQDPDDLQEVVIWDDDDMYTINYRIKDILEPTIEITDVNVE